MKQHPILPIPALEVVNSRIKQFNDDNEHAEKALTLLLDRFPTNTEMPDVLLKVAAINALYNTQIRGIHAVSEHIVTCGIDSRLDQGDAAVVDAIASVFFNGKPRCNYSFATKYCSWHRPDLYPIYDSRVDFCLREYATVPNPFATFRAADLWQYARFRELLKIFREHYGLSSINFKNLDKFLYVIGDEYMPKTCGAEDRTS